MTGGNIRFLLQHMRASGLDRLVRSRVNAGALYLGCSAGAIVAGRSVAAVTLKGWDDPTAAADTDWSDAASMRAGGALLLLPALCRRVGRARAEPTGRTGPPACLP